MPSSDLHVLISDLGRLRSEMGVTSSVRMAHFDRRCVEGEGIGWRDGTRAIVVPLKQTVAERWITS